MESEAAMDEAALVFEELAVEQAAADVPGGAPDLNTMLVDVFTRYHAALTEIATAGEDRSDAQATLVDGMNAFNAASRDFKSVETQMTDLAASCGIPT